MRGLLRAILAGWGASKLSRGGCGCGFIVLFILLFWLLGRIL
jgi:hypothetical protein